MEPKYPKPPACVGCPLEHLGYGYAPYQGPETTRLLFIAEALGRDEAIHGQPLIGAAGGVHTRILRRASMDRDACGHDNIIRCRPPENWLVDSPWEHTAAAHCRQAYLQHTFDRLAPDGVIVPLGLTALRNVLQLQGVAGVGIKDFHGTVSRDPSDRFWVVPTFHPSHLQRGAMGLLDVVTRDYTHAQHIATHGFTRSQADIVVDPSPQWFTAWVDDHLARLAQDLESTWLALDTEFLEASGTDDESELVRWDKSSLMTRVNVANRQDQGVTVPYRAPYVAEIERLLAGVAAVHGWMFLWNKYADLDHLQEAGHTIAGIEAIDLMWAWHYMQPALPRGLGFVAPLASDFGAWKHWRTQPTREGVYAGADGLQTYRVATWLIPQMIEAGLLPVFLRDWHEREQYVLRPAQLEGVPIDRPELEQLHVEFQGKLSTILEQITQTEAAGVLKPKAGYVRRPRGTNCVVCGGQRKIKTTGTTKAGKPKTVWVPCEACDGIGHDEQPLPPTSIIGSPTKGGGEAKTRYLTEGVELVEKSIEIDVLCCPACSTTNVAKDHTCDAQPSDGHDDATQRLPLDQRLSGRDGDLGQFPHDGSTAEGHQNLVRRRISVTRWFWRLPFNPDAPVQILAYLAAQGEAAPLSRKTRKPTTDKAAMKALAKKYGEDDPFYQLMLDWKAVQKVDSTYVVGVLVLLDADDRVHPEITCKPQTLRDSCVGPNLQNVVADREGPASLAAGFRRAVRARDGVPVNRTVVEIGRWASRWGNLA